MARNRPFLFRRRRTDGDDALPARVQERIEEHEAASEVLVGWMQLALVGAFWIAYLLKAPTAAEAVMRPVPWVLAAYTAFTLLRLHLAYRRRLYEPLRYVSIVVDMALLVALVWSRHAEHAAPVSIYVNAAVFAYVFVFIALRALNFSFRKVIAAGFVALVGWGLLAGYVLTPEGGRVIPMREAPPGALPPGALFGVSADRIIAIVAVTVILGVAIRRNFNLLTMAVRASDANQELARFMPAEVAAFIHTTGEGVRVGTAETVEATVMFLDLEEFTTLSQRLDPQRLVATVNAFYGVVAGPLARHGGVIHQFQGDAILATFNAPRTDPDHAAAAVRAALAIQEALQERTFGEGERLHARIGINTGVVVHGMLGTPDRLGYTVIGDEVNVAARLEALNKEHGTTILVSEQTRLAAGAGRFAFRGVDEVQLRGRTGMTRIYSLEGATREAAPDRPDLSQGAA